MAAKRNAAAPATLPATLPAGVRRPGGRSWPAVALACVRRPVRPILPDVHAAHPAADPAGDSRWRPCGDQAGVPSAILPADLAGDTAGRSCWPRGSAMPAGGPGRGDDDRPGPPPDPTTRQPRGAAAPHLGDIRDRACRPRLLRRPGHLRRHRLDRREDRRRGDRRRRRRRPGRRGPGGGPQARARLRRRRGRGARPARRLRRPLLPARAAGRRALHGALPAGVGAVPAGDRRGAGRRRPAVRRGHRRARLHRQGQRPGPLRGRHRRARARPAGARAGPGLRHDQGRGDRLRRAQRPADRRDRPLAVLDRPEPLGPRGRDRLPRGPVERADRGALLLHVRPERAAGAGRGARPLRRRRADRDRRPAGDRPAGHRGAQPAGRRAGRRPARHGRGPAGRHQEPRGLRGARRDRAAHRAPGDRGPHGRAGPAPVRPGCPAALDRARLRRPVVLAAQAGAGRVPRLGPAARDRRGAAAPARRHARSPTGRRSDSTLYDYSLATYDTGDTFDQSLAKGFVQLWGLPSRIAATRDLAATKTDPDPA